MTLSFRNGHAYARDGDRQRTETGQPDATAAGLDVAASEDVRDGPETSGVVASLRSAVSTLAHRLGGNDRPLPERPGEGSKPAAVTSAMRDGLRKRSITAHQQVIEAYDIVLRRLPDETGLEYFGGLLEQGLITPYELILGLYQSDEARTRAVSELGTEADRVAILSPLFEAARRGTLMREHATPDGALKSGALLRSLLADDLSRSILLYDQSRNEARRVD